MTLHSKIRLIATKFKGPSYYLGIWLSTSEDTMNPAEGEKYTDVRSISCMIAASTTKVV